MAKKSWLIKLSIPYINDCKYKNTMAKLLYRVCTVSVETMKIVKEMPKL